MIDVLFLVEHGSNRVPVTNHKNLRRYERCHGLYGIQYPACHTIVAEFEGFIFHERIRELDIASRDAGGSRPGLEIGSPSNSPRLWPP